MNKEGDCFTKKNKNEAVYPKIISTVEPLSYGVEGTQNFSRK
jgi:hypothetical protein